jgi:hypothetical protein
VTWKKSSVNISAITTHAEHIQGGAGSTPVDLVCNQVIDINEYRLKKHCRGLFELPIAA